MPSASEGPSGAAAKPRMVFAGCARDCGQHLPGVLDNLERWSAEFPASAFVFVENDSQDATRELLRQWLQRRPNGTLLRAEGLASVASRSARLALARNVYLDFIAANTLRDADYLVVLDFDSVNAQAISAAAIVNAVAALAQTPAAAAVFACSDPVYYDLWALRHPQWCPGDVWAEVRAERELTAAAAVERYVYARQIAIPQTAQPIQVQSAFGGLGIYRLSAALGARYDSLPDGTERCEHVSFNLAIAERGALFILPTLRNRAPTEHLRADGILQPATVSVAHRDESVTLQTGQLERLLEHINAGDGALALPELDRLLQQQPRHPGALLLRAEALRVTGRLSEAAEAYRLAAQAGAGARAWLAAGMLLASERKTDEALKCLHGALAESPDDEQVLDTLVTTLFNANRQPEAVEFARRQLAIGSNPRFLCNAALLLQGTDGYEESANAFKKILQLAPDEPTLVGAALSTARFTCDWDWIGSLQQRINACYDQGNFAAPQEYPLTHLTWCADEARNLAVTRAYMERTVSRVAPLQRPIAARPAERIRVGYLSCDFRNHATMHLMAGLLESHDRRRFEIFAYDYSSHDISSYRQRFLDAVEHHVPIHSLSDQQAALRIAEDQLDILFDLKGYTGGCRPGILSYRPAPLQAAYLGFPGSTAGAEIDFIVSDRFVTPDSSTPYYTEKFCRLPHSYQCNDRKRPAASEPGTRAMHGLADDKIVFGAFNQTYKVDRVSFAIWLRVLKEVPDSVLWLLGQSNAAIANLSREAASAGLEPHRLVFAPFAEPRQHLARLQLADAVLDTLVCNGHTTTSDALWAGVPVVTARGRHFASRVSESLLNAMDLPELVGADHEEMVRIAKRIGTDAAYRAALRGRIAANRLGSPLFDTQRHTRDFEAAIVLMTELHASGAPPRHIDVPDHGPVAPRADEPQPATPALPLWAVYPACPLCAGHSVTLGFADCAAGRRWQAPLPSTLEWMRCPACGHVHTRQHWTEAGRAEVDRATGSAQPAPSLAEHEARRAACVRTVERVVGLLGGYRSLTRRDGRPIWVDVDCGEGTLITTAADYGFAAVGLDPRPDPIQHLQTLGITALQAQFMLLRFEVVLDVLSMIDALECLPHPSEALAKAARILRPGGVLLIGTPDLSSSSWRRMEAGESNPYWSDIRRHHLFSRNQLLLLLDKAGFEVADFGVSCLRAAQVQIYALRRQ